MATNLSSVPADEFAKLASEVDQHEGLSQVLAWAATHRVGTFVPQIVAEVITQDEFTHDVIVPYKDVFLVYDTT
jgi:hypothetical protein